jgi:anti-sigma-K factor RskA
LIRHRHGDVKKLREIRDTIRHDNFVTTDNKNYVESLITMYLKNQPFAKPSSHQQSDTKIKLQPKSTPNSSDSKNNVAFSFSSNKKLGILAGVVAAIAIIVIVGFTAINQTSTTITEPLLVNVDQATYQRADIISISGNSKSVSTQSVELSIENANGKKIWNENINPKKDGQFSTLVIAGGNGWENDGVYILKATHSDLASEIEFKFLH